MSGHTCEGFFFSWLNHLRWEDPSQIWIFWVGKIHLKSRPHLQVPAHLKDMGEASGMDFKNCPWVYPVFNTATLKQGDPVWSTLDLGFRSDLDSDFKCECVSPSQSLFKSWSKSTEISTLCKHCRWTCVKMGLGTTWRSGTLDGTTSWVQTVQQTARDAQVSYGFIHVPMFPNQNLSFYSPLRVPLKCIAVPPYPCTGNDS